LFYLFLDNNVNPNTIIPALILGLIAGGIALVDSFVFRAKLKTISEGREVPWWQKDRNEILL